MQVPTTWLHFVGRSYWKDIPKFEREARKYGVSRRVSLRDLKRMAWDDRVVLAQWQGKAVAFGQFTITRISGLGAEVRDEVLKRYGGWLIDAGGAFVERECGSYYTGPCFVVSASVADVASVIEEKGYTGPLMVSGPYRPLTFDLLREPAAPRLHCRWSKDGPPFVVRARVVLRDVPHRQGFRAFDWRAFCEAVEEELCNPNGRGMVAVRGQFYASAVPVETGGEGEIQQVVSYARVER